jgi:8-oxo-dGTP pyrophosphatase MutT (NUDIX family)
MAIEQAGAIAIRPRDARTEVLIVRARRNPEHWIFPKGHIEKGETAAETALRELLEEAGVVGTVVARLGTVEFQRDLSIFSVKYFLVRFVRTAEPLEDRETRWLDLRGAKALLTFPDLKEQLDAAERLIRDGVATRSAPPRS